jgi:hypothetical protein
VKIAACSAGGTEIAAATSRASMPQFLPDVSRLS